MKPRTKLILKVIVATVAATLLAVALLSTGEKRIDKPVERAYSTSDPQLRRALGVLLGPGLLEGNRVETLLNGDRIFPPMLEAIRSARKTITFETYIYWSDTVGREFADALVERARAGVKVHVLLDWIGSMKMEEKYLKEMRDAGVEIQRYHEPHWWQLHRMNNRTHRKVLVVDGRVGFTGGVGIADKWRGDARNENEWRDTHYRVEGPVVAQMQAVFFDNWIKANGDVKHGQDYFPPLERRGDMTAQMFSSSPSGGSESMHLMYLLLIAASKDSIDLSASYFVPDDLAVDALVAAAKRGVKVRILTPGDDIDTEIVRRASRARWGPLLQAGIQIAEYQPTMFHCKVLVVDGLVTSVGSTNFDNRSFRINDEANLNVVDAGFAAKNRADFEADWKKARPITYEQWKKRPYWAKVIENASSLLGMQL